jgi:hypothetical protein
MSSHVKIKGCGLVSYCMLSRRILGFVFDFGLSSSRRSSLHSTPPLHFAIRPPISSSCCPSRCLPRPEYFFHCS